MRSVIAIMGWLWSAFGLCAWLLLSGCGASQHDRLVSSLGSFTAAVEPAYAVTVDGCIARQETIALQTEAGRLDAESARTAISEIRAWCDTATAVFDEVRALAMTAGAALDAGDDAAAFEALTMALTRWQAIRGSGGAP